MSDFGAPPPPPDDGGPQYPTGPYQGGPPPPPQPARPAFAGMITRLGDRTRRRPEPRFTVGLAGTGAGLMLLGIVLWGADYWAHGLSNGLSTNRNLLGGALGAVITIVGYVVVVRAGRGPLATAGVVAIGLGWPLTLAFLTLDVTDRPFPINFDAIFWVSVIAWLATYLLVPGARGHTFFVFLAAQGFYTYVLVKNLTSSNFGVSGVGPGFVPRFHGLGTIAAIAFCFGLGYYVIAYALDRRGKHGPATAFVYPAFGALASGIVAWSPDIHEAGVGVLAIVAGLAICWYGGRYGRRITCFAGAAGAVAGIFVLMDKATTDSTTAGVSFIFIGAALIVVAVLLARALREPDDMDPQAVIWSR